MSTIYSYLRLAVGSCLVFLGAARLQNLPSDGLGDYWATILIGGLGLALALHESAYVSARYTRGKLEE